MTPDVRRLLGDDRHAVSGSFETSTSPLELKRDDAQHGTTRPGFCYRLAMWIAGAHLLLFFLGLVVMPELQSPTKQGQSFQSGIQVIEIDVRVTDRHGRFVRDLRPADFEVDEDGVAQQVRTVFLVGTTSPASTTYSGTPSAAQLWVFVFDDRNLQPSGLRRARIAAESFVSRRLRAGDLVAVVHRDTVVNGRISSLPSEILAALRQVRLPGERPDSGATNAFAANLLRERGIRDSLDTLETLAVRLAHIPGPKTIVLFSDGFPLSKVEGALRTVVTRLTEAGARLYAIDTRGLAGEPAHTLNSLAVDTGGLMVFNVNNLGHALEEVEADAGIYYVLGYSSTNSNYDGKFRRIEVRVKRPDTRVRARKGYLAIDPKEMRVPQR